ncbi:hypothetical protein DBL06_25915 [Agrobacterium pusense]|nr:hypothetical protein DBL06_25915 [Agrobacterium pusense]
MKQIAKTIDIGQDKTHLRSFPTEAVTAVIVGAKASTATIEDTRDILTRKYPHAGLHRATPQRMASTFDIHDI